MSFYKALVNLMTAKQNGTIVIVIEIENIIIIIIISFLCVFANFLFFKILVKIFFHYKTFSEHVTKDIFYVLFEIALELFSNTF